MITNRAHNYFSRTVLEDTEAFVRTARRHLKDVDFDTFVVRGMSGAIAGGILARSMKKNLYVVRKPHDDSHDGSKAFGVMGERWLFLDDFVSSGETFWITYDVVRSQLSSTWGYNDMGIWDTIPTDPPLFVGAYLFRDLMAYDVQSFQDHLRVGGYRGINRVLNELQ